jgi:hypothetical protein
MLYKAGEGGDPHFDHVDLYQVYHRTVVTKTFNEKNARPTGPDLASRKPEVIHGKAAFERDPWCDQARQVIDKRFGIRVTVTSLGEAADQLDRGSLS